MKANEKLLIAKELLELNLSKKISQISIDLTYKQLHLILIDGINLYIVYNDHEEYSYSIIFSKLDLDRCRFDNYDDHWLVSSRPHHFHPRKTKEAIRSPMKGLPNQDIIKLVELLNSGKLKSIPS
ncbi:MAG: DUF6516 family protein [Candidatus Odinarchaeota archaeon]